MLKHKILIVFTFISLYSFAQTTIKGKIEDKDHNALVGASVQVLNTTNGTITDPDGRFTLQVSDPESKIVISYVGYIPDTLLAKNVKGHIKLYESAEELNSVVVSSGSTFMDEMESRHTEVITEKELLKAACCNLSESFETNASVDVSLTDAISGAKMIRMLGLDGRYVQINRENIPLVRGLSGRYGLNFVPGTWIQSIDVGKGAGSVVNGFESMTGQINLELKKPESSEKVYFNAYGNSFGRAELNFNHARKLSEKWSGAVLLHADYMNSEIDRNDDDFMDLPKSRQINFLNRYKYSGDRLVSQIGLNIMRDEKAGGQLGFDFGDNFLTSNQYGFVNNTTTVELFGKTGLLFPETPYKGWGFIYSARYTDIKGGFGRRNYDGTETTLYGNVINQNIIGNTFHQYKTGVSILYDDFKENFADSAFSRTEIVPGAYFEYSYLPGDDLSVVLGARTDFHNLYGTYFTPRLHTRYQLNDDLTMRFSAGRGYRTPNVIMENSQILVSSRRLIIQEDPLPEVSWNVGGSLVYDISIFDQKIGLVGDYYYTFFENQLIFDMDQNSSELNVYNLDGEAFAHSFQIEANSQLTEEFGLKAAYKYYDVKATINNQLMQVPLIPRDRVFLNASYATDYDKWKADATVQWYGQKRLPNTSDKPVEFQRDGFSPDFFLLNAQVSRGFRWGNIYLGSENLLDFTQDDPIIDAENPFGDQFDASIVWAPVAGRMIYAGIRYKIK